MGQENSDCCCGSSCGCNDPVSTERKVVIDFLYLDLSVCCRCQGTDATLAEAVEEVSKVLQAAGVQVVINKVNIINEELARKYKFVSSPTIRVNGRDIQAEVRESACESCGDLCGDTVDCRVWVYQGEEYTEPPKAMLIDEILKEVYGPGSNQPVDQEYVLPDNLRQFYQAMGRK